MKSKNMGQIRIIEAFLASLIIFSSFAISAKLTVTQNITKYDNLASTGLQALMKLDSDGSLAKHIDNEEWTALRDTINLVLPGGMTFDLTVYDEQMTQINTDVISNGGFINQDTALVEYVCASQNSTFHCYLIHLYLAGAT
jgi:hypothetical protein